MSITIPSLNDNSLAQLLTGKKSSDKADSTKSLFPTTSISADADAQLEAYKLSLSPEARKYLEESKAKADTETPASKDQHFSLSDRQQKALDAIIKKYADKPLTEENYAQLQADLQAVGLSPEELSLEDKINSFDATKSFLDALNGKHTDMKQFMAAYGQVDETKSDNFLTDVVNRWKDAYDTLHPETDADSAPVA